MTRVPTQGASKSGVQNSTYTYAADAEASDAYAITLTPAPEAYAEGQSFVFKANTANTGASSLNVNGLGAKTLKKLTDQDTETGDIESGSIVEVTYDGTNFQIISTSATEVDITGITDKVDYAVSPMIVTGGAVTVGTNAGTFKVGALTCLLRATDSLTGDLTYLSLAEQDNQTITSADTTYIISLNYNDGVTPTISLLETNPYTADKRNISIGRVMKDGSDNVHYISGGYRFQDGTEKMHIRAKTLRNLELNGGSAIAYSGTNNFTMTEGTIYGGLNKFTVSSYDSASTQFTPIYSDGGAGFTEGADRNTIDFAKYDDGDGTLGDVGVAKYSVHWVYRHSYDGHVYVRYGEGSYALADAETALEPTKPDHLTDFGLLIGKIIAPQAGGSFTVIQMVSDTFFSGTSVSDHAELSNLQGGAVGEYNHITDAEATVLGNTSGANTGDQTYVAPRVSTEASSATPTINTDNVDAHSITALATAVTSMTTNLSGTPTNFQKLIIRFLDNATGRAITWGASFEDNGVALPTTTTASKLLTVGFIYDTASSKWGCVAVADET